MCEHQAVVLAHAPARRDRCRRGHGRPDGFGERRQRRPSGLAPERSQVAQADRDRQHGEPDAESASPDTSQQRGGEQRDRGIGRQQIDGALARGQTERRGC
jgi:hypothetical protein